MATSVVKKVRLGPERARRLQRLARERSKTESQILREGLDLVERVRSRERNIEGLIRFLEGDEPPKIRFALKS